MGTESENLKTSELKEDLKTLTNEMLLVIQRYESLTGDLLTRLERMTKRAMQAEYQNKLVESLLSSGAVLGEMEYHKIMNAGGKNVIN
jgi:hypothetical protein